jgi:L-fuconolactonase
MAIVDAQVHAYERNYPGRPWTAALPGPAEVTGADMVAAMDAAGVDGALLTSPYTVYRFDYSYAVEVQKQFPDRFALVTPFDPQRPDIADAIATWAAIPGTAGVRLMADVGFVPDDAGIRRTMAAVQASGLPICVHGAGRLAEVGAMARAFPDIQFALDHLGLRQAPTDPPSDRFGDLPALLALASCPNLAVKVTGVVTLSNEPFPFADIWGPLEQVFTAFGFDRLMWGTDWTRVLHITYPDTVRAFLEASIDPADKAALMGGTLETIFKLSFPGR